MGKLPLFITLDAELDNGWGRPHTITTENAKGVDKFQSFCENYGMKPIYLTTFEMANDDNFVDATKQKNLNGLCEVGMHMHGWSTPPAYNLTEDDLENLPFIIEYPEDNVRKKVKCMTTLLQQKFELEVVSHRSGRWIINENYLNILVEYGYKIDCSVTPLIDWTSSKGDPDAKGGADYSKYSHKPYVIDLPNGKICEIPMTTMSNPLYNNFIVNTGMSLFPSSLKKARLYNGLNSRKVVMLRPNLRNGKFLMKMIENLRKRNDIDHVEFMIHTSEVYKNTCPHCHTDDDLNAIYKLMGQMFGALNEFCESMTFRDFAKLKKM